MGANTFSVKLRVLRNVSVSGRSVSRLRLCLIGSDVMALSATCPNFFIRTKCDKLMYCKKFCNVALMSHVQPKHENLCSIALTYSANHIQADFLKDYH